MSTTARSRGFSLVELLIAITLGLLLTIGLINIFINSKQSYRLQEATSRMQENGRFAVDALSRAIHLADFWGSVSPSDVALVGGTTYGGVGGCSNAWLINPQEGLRGYEGGASAPVGLPQGCISNYVAGSDAIALRYADPDAIVPTADIASSLSNGSYFLRVLTGRSAVLFNGDSDARGSALGALPDVAGVPGAVLNYRFRPELYYLGNFSAAGITATPSLYFRRALKGEVESTAIVDGVETMHFEYGLDVNGDLSTDRYVTAADIASADWARVLAVRVSLIVRGDQLDRYRDDRSYSLAGGATYEVPAAARNFLRTQIVKEVLVRNRARSRG